MQNESKAEETKKCLLALEDGTTYLGKSFGATGTVTGELVFNTSLYGYQEILTDPSYAGQIITLTNPEIGNYGTNDEDMESRKIYAKGLVVRNLAKRVSSWRSKESLSDFLARYKTIGISDVDTRAITLHIREKGAMRCVLTTEIGDDLEAAKKKAVQTALEAPQMNGQDLTSEVTCPKSYKFSDGETNIAVLDFGIKQNILNELRNLNVGVTVYPSTTSAKTILEDKPDAIFLSNGPGDPGACKEILVELNELIEARLPTFGICLGHQLLSIALGAKTYKLKFGHRGGNQPVKNLKNGKVEITCQNHGFAVDEASVPETLEITHINLNDRSVEGFRHRVLPIFGVQYHPEAHPGPQDSHYLFNDFLELIKSETKTRT